MFSFLFYRVDRKLSLSRFFLPLLLSLYLYPHTYCILLSLLFHSLLLCSSNSMPPYSFHTTCCTVVPSVCHKLHSAITPRILARFPRSKMRLKALMKTFQTMPKTCQSDQYSSRYQLISADTDQQISQELLNVDIRFHVHMEALFNMLLTTINRPKGYKILWRYKDLKVWHDTDLLFIDTHQSLNTTRTAPYMVKLSLFWTQKDCHM